MQHHDLSKEGCYKNLNNNANIYYDKMMFL